MHCRRGPSAEKPRRHESTTYKLPTEEPDRGTTPVFLSLPSWWHLTWFLKATAGRTRERPAAGNLKRQELPGCGRFVQELSSKCANRGGRGISDESFHKSSKEICR